MTTKTTIALFQAGMVGVPWPSAAFEWKACKANDAINRFDLTFFHGIAAKVISEILGLSMEESINILNKDITKQRTRIFKEIKGRNFGLAVGDPKTDRIIGNLSVAVDGYLIAGCDQDRAFQAEKIVYMLVSAMDGYYGNGDSEEVRLCAHIDVVANLALASCYIGKDLVYTLLKEDALVSGGGATPERLERDAQMSDIAVVLEASQLCDFMFHSKKFCVDKDQYEKENAVGFLADHPTSVQFLNRQNIVSRLKGVPPQCKYGRCSFVLFNSRVIVGGWHAKAFQSDFSVVFRDVVVQLIRAAQEVAVEQFHLEPGQEIPCVLMADSNLPSLSAAEDVAAALKDDNLCMFNSVDEYGDPALRLSCYGLSRNLYQRQPHKFGVLREKAGMVCITNYPCVAVNALPISKNVPKSTPCFDKNNVYVYDHTPIDASFAIEKRLVVKPGSEFMLALVCLLVLVGCFLILLLVKTN